MSGFFMGQKAVLSPHRRSLVRFKLGATQQQKLNLLCTLFSALFLSTFNLIIHWLFLDCFATKSHSCFHIKSLVCYKRGICLNMSGENLKLLKIYFQPCFEVRVYYVIYFCAPEFSNIKIKIWWQLLDCSDLIIPTLSRQKNIFVYFDLCWYSHWNWMWQRNRLYGLETKKQIFRGLNTH